jgi:hypothetical protein
VRADPASPRPPRPQERGRGLPQLAPRCIHTLVCVTFRLLESESHFPPTVCPFITPAHFRTPPPGAAARLTWQPIRAVRVGISPKMAARTGAKGEGGGATTTRCCRRGAAAPPRHGRVLPAHPAPQRSGGGETHGRVGSDPPRKRRGRRRGQRRDVNQAVDRAVSMEPTSLYASAADSPRASA